LSVGGLLEKRPHSARWLWRLVRRSRRPAPKPRFLARMADHLKNLPDLENAAACRHWRANAMRLVYLAELAGWHKNKSIREKWLQMQMMLFVVPSSPNVQRSETPARRRSL